MKPSDIWAIVGCEESQAICIELRKLGVQAFSCDKKPCSGGYPQYHLQMDVFNALKGGWLQCQKGNWVKIKKWNYGMFNPTCTRLTNAGVLRLYKDGKKKNGIDPVKWQEMLDGAAFFKRILNYGITYTRVENPIPHGYALKEIGEKYKQIIQPYNFNEDASKATCLWAHNLPIIKKTGYYPPRIVNGKKRWSNQTDSGQNKLPPDRKDNPGRRAELRSKTYPGIAKAIAQQDIAHILKNPVSTLLF
jgi:hypothetical protein